MDAVGVILVIGLAVNHFVLVIDAALIATALLFVVV